jgi:hypothetical protein
MIKALLISLVYLNLPAGIIFVQHAGIISAQHAGVIFKEQHKT